MECATPAATFIGHECFRVRGTRQRHKEWLIGAAFAADCTKQSGVGRRCSYWSQTGLVFVCRCCQASLRAARRHEGDARYASGFPPAASRECDIFTSPTGADSTCYVKTDGRSLRFHALVSDAIAAVESACPAAATENATIIMEAVKILYRLRVYDVQHPCSSILQSARHRSYADWCAAVSEVRKLYQVVRKPCKTLVQLRGPARLQMSPTKVILAMRKPADSPTIPPYSLDEYDVMCDDTFTHSPTQSVKRLAARATWAVTAIAVAAQPMARQTAVPPILRRVGVRPIPPATTTEPLARAPSLTTTAAMITAARTIAASSATKVFTSRGAPVGA